MFPIAARMRRDFGAAGLLQGATIMFHMRKERLQTAAAVVIVGALIAGTFALSLRKAGNCAAAAQLADALAASRAAALGAGASPNDVCAAYRRHAQALSAALAETRRCNVFGDANPKFAVTGAEASGKLADEEAFYRRLLAEKCASNLAP